MGYESFSDRELDEAILKQREVAIEFGEWLIHKEVRYLHRVSGGGTMFDFYKSAEGHLGSIEQMFGYFLFDRNS